MDVDTYAVEKVAASNEDFQELTFPDASEKIEENVILFHLDKDFALENEECAYISIHFQDMVVFQIIEDPIVNLLQPSGKMNFLVFMDHEHMFSKHFEFPFS